MARRQVDVDPGKLTAETVVARARELLRREGRLDDAVGGMEPPYPDLRSRAASIVSARLAVQPPDLGTTRSGAAARVAVLAKRAVRKATYWYVEPRFEAQGRFDDEVVSLAQELGVVTRTMEGATSVQSSSIEHVTEQTELALGSLRARCEELEREVVDLRREVELRARDEDLLALRRRLEEWHSAAVGTNLPIDYVAFEERFRGSSDHVRETQREYVSLLLDSDDTGPVVDIGCGRGEMLALLAEAGASAIGIDIDDGMLAVCATKGLDVERASAVDWLSARDDESLRGIYLAQVVEHLPTADLIRLVHEAARTLAPGGVFLAETIDPRSLFATANYFWADLSHVRPVHPATLAFLLETAGFASTTVLPRSPHPFVGLGEGIDDTAAREAVLELVQTVFGTQDYALVARR